MHPQDPYRRRLAALRAEQDRGRWRTHWEQLADYILPRHGRFVTDEHNRGDPLNSKILDSTATQSARILASGMMSGLTSPARPWFRLTTTDPELAEFGPVKEFLYQTQRRMEMIYARSNLYNVLPTAYESLGVFGTSATYSQEDFDDVLRFYDFPVGSYYIGLSARGEVDTLYRTYKMTVYQMVAMFGLDRLSRSTADLWRNGQPDQWVEVVHAIEPNDTRVVDSPFTDGMAFRSVWYEPHAEVDRPFLRVSGYFEFPAFCPRWWVTGEDVYGRSAGMDVLPDVKQLQFMQGRKLVGIEKLMDPPVRAHPGVGNVPAGVINTLPGGVSFGAEGAIDALYQVDPKLEALKLEMDETRARIRRGMFEDLFLMLSQLDRSQITAYEIAERKEEKLLMLGPVLERLNDELLDPLTDRAYAILERTGLLPQVPEDLLGQELRVEYISILHQAQRAVGVGGIDRFAAAVSGWAQLNPTILDKWDMDQTADEYADLLGIPPRIVRSDEQVEQVRAERAQREALDATIERAAALAPAAKQAAEAEIEDGESVLNRTLGLVGAA